MRYLFIVMFREIKDNLRDRRSFFFALVYGPLLMPALIFVPMILGIKSNMVDYDATTNLHVIGAEHAPNLIRYLRNNNLIAVETPEGFRKKVKEREINVVLEITKEYGEKFIEGKRAPLTLYFNESSKKSQSAVGHVRNVLKNYSAQLGYLRMLARGLDPEIQSTINIIENDLSSEGISGLILGFFVYFIVVFSMMTGGFYLAVDSTAGERERNSLEPLLSLPISRFEILAGKWLAVFSFVTLSSLLSAFSIYFVTVLFPMDEALFLFQLDGWTLFLSFMVALPCCFLISAVLVAVAAYTRSTKEAQTYISMLYLIPLAPTIVGQFLDLKASLLLSAVPFLSQYQLINKILKDEMIFVHHVGLSVAGTLAFASVMFFVAIHLYRQDKILS